MVDLLQPERTGIIFVVGHQFCMSAIFDDSTLVHRHHPVCKPYGRNAMRDDQNGFLTGHRPDGVDDSGSGIGVDLADGVVQKQERSVTQKCPCQCDTLLLSTGENNAPFTHNGIKSKGQRLDGRVE